MPKNPAETPLSVKDRDGFLEQNSFRPFLFRYGLALGTIAVTLTTAVVLARSSISINLTILVVIALLIPTWYGGLGPGLMVAISFELVSIVSKMPTSQTSIPNYVFGHVSVIALYVFLVVIVNARRNAEKQLKNLNDTLEQRVSDRTVELQAANKELEAFSFSVSHDLRAPLRHINGFSQILLEDYDDKLDDEGKEHLGLIRNASQEMALLIDDILELARVGRSEMHRERIDLTKLANDVVAELREREPERNVRIIVEDMLSAVGDARLMKVVLVNLLGNAWKFTSKRENAEINFGYNQTRREFFVRDNGAGFDMAHVDKLFGAFQRLHGGQEFEGTGIGLATVQRIIHRHGETVWAEGAVNQGATIYFTLPDSRESS